MTIYISLFVVLVALTIGELLFAATPNEKRLTFLKNILLTGLIGYMILLLGNRGFTGTDSYNYYLSYIGRFDNSRLESGYLYLREYSLQQGYNFENFQMLIAVVTLIPLWLIEILNKNSRFKFLTLLATFTPFFYFAAFNAMRQGVAISFLLLGFYLYSNRLESKARFLYLLIFGYIASLFHGTAIFFPVIIFGIEFLTRVTSQKTVQRVKIVAILSVFTALIVRFNVMNVLLEISGKLGFIYAQRFLYSDYNTSSFSDLGKIYIVLLLLIYLGLKVINPDSFLQKFEIYLFGVMLIIFAMVGSANNSMRLMYYFFSFQSIALPLMIQDYLQGKQYSRALYIFSVLIIFVFVSFVASLLLNLNGIIPYIGR